MLFWNWYINTVEFKHIIDIVVMCFSLIIFVSPIMFHLHLLPLKIWDADAMNMSVFSELHWCVIQLDRFREGPEKPMISQGLVSPLVFHGPTQYDLHLHDFISDEHQIFIHVKLSWQHAVPKHDAVQYLTVAALRGLRSSICTIWDENTILFGNETQIHLATPQRHAASLFKAAVALFYERNLTNLKGL